MQEQQQQTSILGQRRRRPRSSTSMSIINITDDDDDVVAAVNQSKHECTCRRHELVNTSQKRRTSRHCTIVSRRRDRSSSIMTIFMTWSFVVMVHCFLQLQPLVISWTFSSARTKPSRSSSIYHPHQLSRTGVTTTAVPSSSQRLKMPQQQQQQRQSSSSSFAIEDYQHQDSRQRWNELVVVSERHRNTVMMSVLDLDQKRLSFQQRPTMFLGDTKLVCGRRIKSSTGKVHNNLPPPDILTEKEKKRRGVLGFDVFELQASRQQDIMEEEELDDKVELDKHQTKRKIVRKTKLSNEEWKNVEGFDTTEETSDNDFDHPGSITAKMNSKRRTKKNVEDNFFPSPGLTWQNAPLSSKTMVMGSNTGNVASILSNRGWSTSSSLPTSSSVSSSSSDTGLLQQSLPAWFPWIPTKSQIESLKLTELKEACWQRGLTKTGNKSILQDRLWQWTIEQQKEHQARLTGDYLTNWFEDMSVQDIMPLSHGGTNDTTTSRKIDKISEQDATPIISNTPNSLEDWSRNVDLDKLMNKRQEIHRQKRQGKKPDKVRSPEKDKTDEIVDPKEYLARITKAMQASPSSPLASNKEVQELYKASKQADQLGERRLAIELLETLLEITPSDARVYRRLSRMYREQGNLNLSRAILQKGLRMLPDNPWLWHGLGQLEISHGQVDLGVKYYRRAITEDPTFANSYHAWGLYEYSHGQIAKAMKIFKKGIEYCPTNHRLHHALGDVYRGAKMLMDAERCYRRAIQEGPPVSHNFAYSALACVSYERGDIDEARRWLYRSIQINNGRHAKGWLALAEMEEAEGNPEKALQICQASIVQYEKGLIESRQRYKRERDNDRRRQGNDASRHDWNASQRRNERQNDEYVKSSMPLADVMANPEAIKKSLLKSVPPYRSGDKFLAVFRHWARLEGRYGSFESANQAYERASLAFPLNYQITLDWAEYNAKLRNEDKARSLFIEACAKASNNHADSFQKYASYEMSLGNFQQARKILFRGAQSMAESADGGLDSKRHGMARLFVTWAACEWHLGNIPRTEMLFDHALRLTEAGDDGSELRSYILYNMGRLEYYERDEKHLAQHCIGLCLKENKLLGGNAPVWELWSEIARDLDDPYLQDECLKQIEKCRIREQQPVDTSQLILLKASEMENWMRQEPWHEKLQTVRGATFSANAHGIDNEDALFYKKLHFPSYRTRSSSSVDDELDELSSSSTEPSDEAVTYTK